MQFSILHSQFPTPTPNFHPMVPLFGLDSGSGASSDSDSDFDDEIPLDLRLKFRRKSPITFGESKTLDLDDRISNLPDSILLHILTFLPLTDAIGTQSLSKRWDHLWDSIPSLVFRLEHNSSNNLGKFMSFVDRTLVLYNSGAFIERFCVAFNYFETYKQNVHSWIRFAVNRQVEEIDLQFHESMCYFAELPFCYNLPRFLCRYETIKVLNLRHCSFRSCGGDINWKSLRRLSMSLCSIDDAIMAKILAGSPGLEYLELDKCYGFNRVEIDSIALKELVINGYFQYEYAVLGEDYVMTISAPYLQLLIIAGYMSYKKYRLENLSSLVEARLSLQLNDLYVYDDLFWENKTMMIDILGRIQHVKKLTLGSYCLQIISLHDSKPLPSRLSMCKNLILEANPKNSELPGLACMLQSCPGLERLTINLMSSPTIPSFSDYSSPDDGHDGGSFWTLQCNHTHFSCMQNLKTVKIIGLVLDSSKTKLVIEFLQFFLKHARVLEKLSINTRQQTTTTTLLSMESHRDVYVQRRQHNRYLRAKKNSLFAVARELLRFPRSSPFAEIQLSK